MGSNLTGRIDHELDGKKVKITKDGKAKGQTGKITSSHPKGLYDPNNETFIVKYDGPFEFGAGMFTVFEFEVLDEETNVEDQSE